MRSTILALYLGGACFTAPDQRLRIQRHKICVTRDDLIAKPYRLFHLLKCQVFICRTIQMIIPNATAHRVQYDPLKAMIIAHWPMSMRCSRKFRHYVFCECHILRHQIGGVWCLRRYRQIQFHITKLARR